MKRGRIRGESGMRFKGYGFQKGISGCGVGLREGLHEGIRRREIPVA